MSERCLNFLALGQLAYGEAQALQERLHAQVAGRGLGPCVLMLEHPPVVTLGRHADTSHLHVSPAELAREGVELYTSDRGGQVTAHMPGQLVVYPILPLGELKLLPRQYIFRLEQCIIDLLRDYGLEGEREHAHPGVWVGQQKIAAVGVRIKQRTSFHGLALNVCNSLALFEQMSPCGIEKRGVTSLARLSELRPTLADVAERLAKGLVKQLAISHWRWTRLEELGAF